MGGYSGRCHRALIGDAGLTNNREIDLFFFFGVQKKKHLEWWRSNATRVTKRDNQKKIASTNELLISIRFFQIFKK